MDLRVKCLLKRAEWMRQLGDSPLEEILDTVMQARQIAEGRFSVWHAWAVTNYDQLQKASEANNAAAAAEEERKRDKMKDTNSANNKSSMREDSISHSDIK